MHAELLQETILFENVHIAFGCYLEVTSVGGCCGTCVVQMFVQPFNVLFHGQQFQ